MKELGDFAAAIESYEHAITLNKSQSATLRSLCDLALIRIQERDIYLAYYTLDRVNEIPEDLSMLFHLKIFLNGAVNMVKKKFKDGLEDLQRLDVSKLVDCNIEPLVLSYQAYGYFCLGKVAEALALYTELETKGRLVEGDTYNLLLCKGILHGEAKEFDDARKFFEKARSMFRLRVEPTFYLVVAQLLLVSRPYQVRGGECGRVQQLPGRQIQSEVQRPQEQTEPGDPVSDRPHGDGNVAQRFEL